MRGYKISHIVEHGAYVRTALFRLFSEHLDYEEGN